MLPVLPLVKRFKRIALRGEKTAETNAIGLLLG